MNWHGDEKENERTQDAQEMSQKMCGLTFNWICALGILEDGEVAALWLRGLQ